MILVIGACFVSRTFSHRSVGYYSRCPQLWSEAAEEAAAPLQQDAGFASGGTNQLDTDGWWVCQDRTNILVISDREREREHQIHQDQDGLLDVGIPVWAVLAVAHPMIFKQFWVPKLGWRETSQSIITTVSWCLRFLFFSQSIACIVLGQGLWVPD